MDNLPQNGIMLMLAGTIGIVLIATLGIIIHMIIYNGVSGEQSLAFLQQMITMLLPSVAIAYAGFHLGNKKEDKR